jgi:hypothetical protein
VPSTSTLNFASSEYVIANGTITRIGTGGQVYVKCRWQRLERAPGCDRV